MLLVSDRPLYIAKVMHPEGIPFECSDDRTVSQLIAEGIARPALPPKILYETKVVSPPEVGPTIPFRDGAVSDEKQTEVAAEGNPVLPSSNVPEQGASNPGRWREHGRSGRKRKS